MNDEVFGPIYADVYDAIYGDKGYAAECDLIERIFRDYGNTTIRSILDLGCGTGSHAIPLSQRGFEVVGVDLSESMLARARRKAANLENNSNVVLHQGDIRAVDLKREFDAVLMMFAVLDYQRENADVLAALHTARRHLRDGGLVLFDVWYGPAVLLQRPSQRIKVIPTSEGQIIRVASGELDIRHHVCTVHYRLWHFKGKQLVSESQESHLMRYFFPKELELFLEYSNFALVRLGAFPAFDQEPDETTWNMLCVARAV